MAAKINDRDLINKFERETNLLSTRADGLVDLVKKKNEISFDEAAKILDVSPETVEAWANFLEEERILSIKYNFTTPMINLFHEGGSKKTQKMTKSELKIFEEKKDGQKAGKKGKEGGGESSSEEEGESKEKIEEIKIRDFDDMNSLLEKAYEYIKKNDFDNARKVYEAINKRYNDMPSEFIKKKNLISGNLVKLGKNLEANLNKKAMEDMESNSNQISKLIEQARGKLKEEDVAGAIKVYGEIKKCYNKLPDVFMQRKLLIQNKVIEIYDEIITARQKKDQNDASEKKAEIEVLLDKIKQALDDGDLRNAIGIYSRIREVYNSMPAGFLDDKAEIQYKTIIYYKRILSQYKEITQNDMKRKSNEIDAVCELIKEDIETGDFESAKENYMKAKEVFNSFPEGFLKVKTEIHKRLLKIYEILAYEVDKRHYKEIEEKCMILENLISRAMDYLKNKESKEAYRLYKEIIQIYNTFPPGFLKKKMQIRSKLLNIYDQISFLAAGDKEFVGPDLSGREAGPIEKQNLLPKEASDEKESRAVEMHNILSKEAMEEKESKAKEPEDHDLPAGNKEESAIENLKETAFGAKEEKESRIRGDLDTLYSRLKEKQMQEVEKPLPKKLSGNAGIEPPPAPKEKIFTDSGKHYEKPEKNQAAETSAQNKIAVNDFRKIRPSIKDGLKAIERPKQRVMAQRGMPIPPPPPIGRNNQGTVKAPPNIRQPISQIPEARRAMPPPPPLRGIKGQKKPEILNFNKGQNSNPIKDNAGSHDERRNQDKRESSNEKKRGFFWKKDKKESDVRPPKKPDESD